MHSQPLNPYLYGRLKRRFGSVQIASQGEAMVGRLVDLGNGKPEYKISSPGEYYRVNCPFCPQKRSVDTRHRLWINHRWGVGPDGIPREKMWWAAICYNERCLENYQNRHELRTMIYGGVGRDNHSPQVRILRGNVPSASLGLVRWPGRCLRVDQLSRSHHAYQYLLSRGFDPAVLGPEYNVSFCQELDPDYPMAHNRLIIPIYMRAKMVGWQARHVGELDQRTAHIPKYWNCPGINKRLMLYGFDAAVALPFCIVVEGVTDVWAVGAGAVALLGKTMSPQQFDLIRSHWKAAVVLLDEDAVLAAEEMHHRLRQAMPVVQVPLPPGTDPATIDKEYMWDLIHRAAAAQGVDLLGLANENSLTSR